MPRVVPDHDRRAAGRVQVRREAGSGADHDGAVHPIGPSTERAAQARSAELEAHTETIG